MSASTLALWNRFSTKPLGKWFFSRLVCLKAPYFRTIKPVFAALQPGHCELTIVKRRRVLNHIGTVHAIAMCNMAELAAGTMTDVTVPASHRWIPKGMAVEYLQKATTDLRAVARPLQALPLDGAGDYPVEVSVTDSNGTAVFRAVISMWISAKPARPA